MVDAAAIREDNNEKHLDTWKCFAWDLKFEIRHFDIGQICIKLGQITRQVINI